VGRVEKKFVGQAPVVATREGGGEVDERRMRWQGGAAMRRINIESQLVRRYEIRFPSRRTIASKSN
jgi:hypothetical protein